MNGSETICSGASVYATVTGGHMTRQEFAEENPVAVAKVLAGWLRAVHFINQDANREEVLDFMAAFFAEHEVQIPRSSLELDLILVGLFGLQTQLDLMERRGDPALSNYDIWTNEVGNFMLENGVVSNLTSPADYITDEYLKMINDDPELRDWATGKIPEGLDQPTNQSAAIAFQCFVSGTLALTLASAFLFCLG